jgi:cation diffusion facilitator CzcD-associated flavoprotein CzcO
MGCSPRRKAIRRNSDRMWTSPLPIGTEADGQVSQQNHCGKLQSVATTHANTRSVSRPTQLALQSISTYLGEGCVHAAAIMDRRVENFKRAIADSDVQKNAQELFRKGTTERLGVSEKGRRAAELLLPSFPVGCRRQTPGPGFHESLTQENVEMLWDDVQSITSNGIVTRSGEVRDYDVIVCATGFDTSFKPSFPLVGRNGVNIANKWSFNQPKAYFGFTVPDKPNYFTFIVPNSPISNGSLVLGIQATAVYIYKWLEKLQTESIKSFEVRHDVNEEYNQHMQKYLERTVWTKGCRSWYKRGTVDGSVVAIYGSTSFHLMEAIKKPR